MLDDWDLGDYVFLELQRTFDTVPHKRLRCKLASHGTVADVWT